MWGVAAKGYIGCGVMSGLCVRCGVNSLSQRKKRRRRKMKRYEMSQRSRVLKNSLAQFKFRKLT